MASFLFRSIRVIIVLGVALGIGFWLFSTREKPQKKEIVSTPPAVRVIQAKPMTLAMDIEAFDTVIPRKKVQVAAEVGGRIDYINPLFREGGVISKNDLLIRIDQRSFILDKKAAQVRLDQAKADIEQLNQEVENLKADAKLARMNMELSLKELERLRALSKNQFASITNLDKAEQRYLESKIQLQSTQNHLALIPSRMALKESALAMARTELSKAALILEKSEIFSTFEGLVLAKHAEMGEFVNPGQILGSIYEKDALDVDVSIPMEELKWIHPMLEKGPMPPAVVSIANIDKENDMTWQAKVVRIKANIDEKTRTLPLTIEIGHPAANLTENTANPNGILNVLKPGTFVKCRITGQTCNNIYQVPRHLMKTSDTLFLAEDDHLVFRKVFVLREFEDKIFIDKGLAPGELIVASPLPGALEGMALTVRQDNT